MADLFGDRVVGLSDPLTSAEAIVADTDFTSGRCRALWIGAAGDVAVRLQSGADVIFKAVPEGTLLPIRCLQVRTTGTTAGVIAASLAMH